MKKHKVIANPAAGGRASARAIPQVELLSRQIEVVCQAPGGAR